MSIIQFGKTWWGEKWLEAFLDISYENRIPRGKSYARKGAVLNVNIKNNRIAAFVQGSRKNPYSVEIIIPEFRAAEKKSILEIIKNNGLYLSSLLARQMPEDLHQSFIDKKIYLFPRKWDDLKANCSCPDWAVPCKHIAAVICMVANEIDKNPFLVFSLHNFDMAAELKSAGFDVEKSEKESIKSVQDILKKDSYSRQSRAKLEYEVFDAIDFSLIPNMQNDILFLLSDNPLFYQGKNFKAVLAKYYKGMAGLANDFLAETYKSEEDGALDFAPFSRFYLRIDQRMNLTVSADDADCAGLKQLLTFFNHTNPAEIRNFPDSAVIFYYLYHFSLKLIEQSAFIPQILKIGENKYAIRWIPAMLNGKIKTIFNQFLGNMPEDIVLLACADNRGKNKKAKQKKFRTRMINKEQQALAIISQIIHFFSNEYCQESLLLEDSVSKAFFAGTELGTARFEQKELATTINLWLSNFYIAHKDFAPVLKIEEDGNDFSLEALIDNTQNQLEAPIALEDVLMRDEYKDMRTEALKDLSLLSARLPEIKTLLTARGPMKISIPAASFSEILFHALPAIKLLGIRILLPKGMEEIVRPQLTVHANKQKSATFKSYLSMSEMLSFQWKVALGNENMQPEEFFALVKQSSGIVKIKNQYVYIGEKDIEYLIKQTKRGARLSQSEISQALFANEYKGAKIELSKEVLDVIQELLQTKNIKKPKGLTANLRPYQKNGFSWLCKNARINLGSLIADDMGLGKTVQVIALIAKLKQEMKTKNTPGIVIAPTTLLTNWQKEIEKFAPGLKAAVYHGQNRELKMKKADLILTTYGLVKRDLEIIKKENWEFVVIDEAQNIKNPDAKQTKAVKILKSKIKIAMTGTPVENRLSEYWSILDFLNPGQFGTLPRFKEEFAKPIELERDQRKLEIFKKITAPFILRRVKTDKSIINDLPDKIVTDQFVNLTGEQASLYQNVLDDIMQNIEKSEAVQRRGMVFKLITALKQVCNHPAHYLKKQDAIPGLSGKMLLLLELLASIHDSGEKALIFTQYTEMGNLLVKALAKSLMTEPLFLHGGLSRKQRDMMVDKFQNEKQCSFMILSLKAGGTGLNLTAASNVIHYDLWWNPAVEAQATDRAFRIGQTKNVMVHRLITKGTFEEKIDQMIKDKKELADLAVSQGEKWIGQMTDEELNNIFKLEK